MRALSIRQPWAWLIVNGYKDIENRDWYTKFRGEFYIHASKTMTNSEYEDAREFAQYINPGIQMPLRKEYELGGIVGKSNLIDCVQKSDSEWFFGKHGFVLRDSQSVPFIPWKGQLGFFEVNP